MYEEQLTQLSQQVFNMESAALATDNLRNTMATLDAMKMANKEMRKQYGKIDVNKIDVLSLLYSYGKEIADIRTVTFRTSTTIWKTYWSKRMRYESH
jgi:hypothetical protein